MPPPAAALVPLPPLRLCIVGDSHMACLRNALRARMVRPGRIEPQFWGNIGRRFRMTHLEDGAITPDDPATARRFAAINAEGRESLSPAGFDAVLFMGCRLDVNWLFADALHRARAPGMFLSRGVRRAMIAHHLRKTQYYRYACAFAAARRAAGGQGARIYVAPVSLLTAGRSRQHLDLRPLATEGTAAERAEIWAMIAEVMAEDGIELVAQPDATVVEGCFTDARFATLSRSYAATDAVHKNADYGALILRNVFRRLREAAPPDAVLDPPAIAAAG